MKSRDRERQTISEQASQWLCLLTEGDAADPDAFLEWLKRSPHHVEEFLLVSAAWKKLRTMGADQPMSIDEILAEVLTPGVARNVISLGRAPTPESAMTPVLETSTAREPLRSVRWVAGLAAFLSIGIVSWWLVGPVSAYSTEVGEQRTVSLEDGSVLYLNTDSRVRVLFSARSREIRLLKGEALFVVAHDVARPFLVRTDDATVQAVGTQFNVRRLLDDTRVSVIDGRVKLVRDRTAAVEFLAAGEQATIAGSGRIVKAEAADVSQAIAWRERRLVFKAETLENVVNEINRYSVRQFRVEGERARETRLTATFDADQLDSLASFLRQYGGLSVEARGDEFVIRER